MHEKLHDSERVTMQFNTGTLIINKHKHLLFLFISSIGGILKALND